MLQIHLCSIFIEPLSQIVFNRAIILAEEKPDVSIASKGKRNRLITYASFDILLISYNREYFYWNISL